MKLRYLLVLLGTLIATPAPAQETLPELQEAAKLHQAGKLDQALEIYNKVLREDAELKPTQRAGALLMRGRALYQKRDMKGAAADYDAAIEIAPDNTLGYLSRAALRVELGEFEGALADFDRVLAVRPDFVPAVVARARILGELRRYGEAAETWSRLLAKHPNDPAALHQRGVAYGAAGDHVQAKRDFDAALAAAPGRPEILLDRAGLRAAAGDYAEALNDVGQAMLIAPTEAAPFRTRGRIRFAQGEFAGAIADFTAADAAAALKGRRDPYIVLWLHAARLRTGAGDVADLRRRLAGADLDAWPGPIAQAYLGEGSLEATIAAAEAEPKEVLRNERLCEAYFYLGEAEIAAGRVVAGEALLRKAVATDATWFAEWRAARAEIARLPR